MWKYDGWDSVFRLGVVAPHADIGPEAEIQAMLENLCATTHGARVNFAPMHPGGTIDEKIAHAPVGQFVAPEVLDPVLNSLSSSPLDAIGLAFTSSSFHVGVDGERELRARLTGLSHGIPIETTAHAATMAIRALDLRNVAVMAPSWFDLELCEAGLQYFVSQGIDVHSVTPSGPTGGPLAITPERTASVIQELIRETDAEAIFVAGNGQRAVGVIDQLERTLNVTVLTANQVLLWACMDAVGFRGKITGYGRLFAAGDPN